MGVRCAKAALFQWMRARGMPCAANAPRMRRTTTSWPRSQHGDEDRRARDGRPPEVASMGVDFKMAEAVDSVQLVMGWHRRGFKSNPAYWGNK